MLLLALPLLGVGATFLWLRRSLPQLSGQATVAGLAAPVEVLRDRHGIPHIYAGSLQDAYAALGYVHAQDRLWQMDFHRRLGSGTLSELFGPDALPHDRLMRVLGLRRAAKDNLPQLDGSTRRLLAAYARGINAFIAEGNPLPPEFSIFSAAPQRFHPVDSLLWLKMMALTLSGNWEQELLRVALSERLSPTQIAQLLTPDSEAKAQHGKATQGLSTPAKALLALQGRPLERKLGSNSWALTGRHTESGKPLLANDPHLELHAPTLWYFAHLHAPGVDVIGATLPGMPGVLLGRNSHVAWSFTNTESDTQDLFIEKLDPQRPDHYLTPDGPRPFDTIHEIIHVRDRADEVLTVRSSRNGPIVSDADERARLSMPSGQVLALGWTALRADDRTMQFPEKAARARSADELLAATRDFHAPQQNVVFADAHGQVGFIAAGRVPLRPAETGSAGTLPVPGWTDDHRPTGFIPWDALPRELGQTPGMLVTANQRITPPDYPYVLGDTFDVPYRADRIATLLSAQGNHTVETFARIQLDVHSGSAQQLLPSLLQARAQTAEQAQVLARLRTWDGDMTTEAVAPLLFSSWVRALLPRVYADDLGPLFERVFNERIAFLSRVLRDPAVGEPWCDVQDTPEKESCRTQVERALADALADLRQRYGDDPEGWTWGAAHPVSSRHPILGDVPLLGHLVNVGVRSGGDNHSINLGGYFIGQPEQPFVAREGAGFRAIYDLAKVDNSRFVLSTGQSGHPLSPHYRDQSELWRDGRYIPMVTARKQVERSARHRLLLRPPSK